jgi:hypothetical protein
MPHALWLLLGLRIRGWLRRALRGMRRPKGLLLALVGMSVFLPTILGQIMASRAPGVSQPEFARRFGPVLMLIYCIVSLVTTGTGDRAILFTPAEMNLLFSAPFRQRQLLAYKLIAAVGTCLLMAPLMALFLQTHSPSLLSAVTGLALALVFIQLFTMAVGFASSTGAIMAHNRRRKAVLVGVVLLISALGVSLGRDAASVPFRELAQRAENSVAARLVLAPFRPFLNAYTASRVWPDLIGWAGVGLAINLVLAGFIFALDAQYMEQAAAASAKVYARLEQARRGGGIGLLRPSKRRSVALPMLPYWRGAGPNAWRQLMTARRDIGRLILGLLFFVPMVIPLVLLARGPGNAALGAMLPGTALGMALILTFMAPFDFRGDIDRIAELKTLPISSRALAIGQLAAPVAVLTVLQWGFMLLVAVWRWNDLVWGMLLGAVTAPPLNLLLVGIDNLLFLVFPMRLGGSNAVDFQSMGRAIVTMLAKFLAVALAAGLAAGIGAAAYYLGGGWPGAMLASWLMVTVCGLALIPWIALAFDRFDVARDTPP